MSEIPTRIDFRGYTRHVPPKMPASVQNATTRFLGNRQAVVNLFGVERWEALRQAGHEIRLHGIRHLDYYLTQLEQRVTEAGGHVHWARDAAEARQIVLQIAREHHVRSAVKVKSMATEEIGLNHALIEAGIPTLETDLGEYIIQLAGVGPSHIIAPAVHLSKEGIAELFEEKLKVEAPPDPKRLTEIARGKLREAFLSADMGISGANFLVAETGTLVIVTNEGNGRMCTTLPPLLVSVVGIDKVVPDWESLTVLLKLLARSGTGQKMSTYTSLISGPSKQPGEGGPQEWHLVLLDNGRTKILADEIGRETMLCIRCGACLNTCPVYNNVGGYAYGWVYSGPIGAILNTQLLGVEKAGALPFASSLCGACNEICPVKIPITEILLHLRHRVVEGDRLGGPSASPVLAAGVTAGTLAFQFPWLYETGSQLLKVVQAPLRDTDGASSPTGAWLPKLPPPVDRWTLARPFPAFAADFRSWWRQRSPAGRRRDLGIKLSWVAAALALVALVAGLLGKKRR